VKLGLFKFSKDARSNVHSIKKRTLKMILEASKSSYPEEFGAFLRAEKGVIHELILLPGTVSGQRHAIFKLHMLPIDFTIVGTVHSHPSGACIPSDADLQLFRRYGWIHIIACMPYDRSCWACFDMTGQRRELKVVD
jgi:proteasome lid subunit RPN8/RPN11